MIYSQHTGNFVKTPSTDSCFIKYKLRFNRKARWHWSSLGFKAIYYLYFEVNFLLISLEQGFLCVTMTLQPLKTI